MKLLCNLLATCCLVAVVGCSSTQDAAAPAASPGAVSECSAACEKQCCPDQQDANLGAVEDEAKSQCCPLSGQSAETSFGAVSESNCASKSSCATKSDCATSCDKDKASDASFGAVSDAPAACSKEKKSCCPVTNN